LVNTRFANTLGKHKSWYQLLAKMHDCRYQLYTLILR